MRGLDVEIHYLPHFGCREAGFRDGFGRLRFEFSFVAVEIAFTEWAEHSARGWDEALVETMAYEVRVVKAATTFIH